MKSILLAAAVVLFAAPLGRAASIVTTNPSDSSFYRVSIDPLFFDFDYDFASVNAITATAVQTDDFWTDAPNFWIFGADNIGSLHFIDLDPMPTLVAIELGQRHGSDQDYGYRYYYGATGPTTPLAVTLPVQSAVLGLAVPEPATIGGAALGLLGAFLAARRRR